MWQGASKKRAAPGTTFITVGCGWEPAAPSAGSQPSSPRGTPSRHPNQPARAPLGARLALLAQLPSARMHAGLCMLRRLCPMMAMPVRPVRAGARNPHPARAVIQAACQAAEAGSPRAGQRRPRARDQADVQPLQAGAGLPAPGLGGGGRAERAGDGGQRHGAPAAVPRGPQVRRAAARAAGGALLAAGRHLVARAHHRRAPALPCMAAAAVMSGSLPAAPAEWQHIACAMLYQAACARPGARPAVGHGRAGGPHPAVTFSI